MNDLISRQQALKEMWKALYEYEDKTEKQFQKSKDLDVRDWIMNDRLWVQNGHNLCVNVLANLPSAQPQRKTGEWLELTNTNHTYVCSVCGRMLVNITDGKNTVTKNYPFCHCGADMRGESE